MVLALASRLRLRAARSLSRNANLRSAFNSAEKALLGSAKQSSFSPFLFLWGHPLQNVPFFGSTTLVETPGAVGVSSPSSSCETTSPSTTPSASAALSVLLLSFARRATTLAHSSVTRS